MNRKQYNPVNRGQRLVAIAAAILISAFLFDGVASISARYDANATTLAKLNHPRQIAQVSTETAPTRN